MPLHPGPGGPGDGSEFSWSKTFLYEAIPLRPGARTLTESVFADDGGDLCQVDVPIDVAMVEVGPVLGTSGSDFVVGAVLPASAASPVLEVEGAGVGSANA